MDSFRLRIEHVLRRRWLVRVRAAGVRGRPSRGIVAAALVALAPFVAPLPAGAAGRVALVVVGEDYQKLQKSIIGVKRADDIAEALQAKGFDVLVGANPTNSRARALLLDFSQKANGADLAVAFLIGHETAADGRSYFLPVNTELAVATDLFARGISISSVAQIASKAKGGAVIVLMTAPNFETAIPGLDARPEYAAENPKSVVTVFSSSAKVPVSRIDGVSERAADAVAKLLQQPAPSLAELVKAASADVGAVYGAPADVSLAKPIGPAPIAAVAPPPAKPAAEADLQEEQKARAEAERRAKEEDAQAQAAQLQLQQAQTDLERAKIETQRAQAEALRAQADAEKAKADAQAQVAQAQAEAAKEQTARAEAEAKKSSAQTAAAPVDDKQLGQRQRQSIQERSAPPLDRRKSPPGAKVYFNAPADGAAVPLTFTVKSGLVGMGVAPAGVDKPNSGQHHLLIDTALPALDQPIPDDEKHLHFGAGQTEATITLPRGKHTLQLLLADADRMPHDPPIYSKPITVFVGMTVAARPAAVRRPVRSPVHYARHPPAGVRAEIPAEIPASTGATDGRCQTGFHDVPAPNGSGYRCVQDGF